MYNSTGVGGGNIVVATGTSVTAGAALPQTGLLPETGASDINIMVLTAVITFAVMIGSHLVMRLVRSHYTSAR
jgi:hypothetical protein